MQVRELMTQDPEACLAADSCGTALAIMRRRDCGLIPIVESHAVKRVIGIVTERDIARHLARVNRPADHVPIAECMKGDTMTIVSDASLEEAVKLMKRSAVHCLIVAENERLLGVLSPKDLAVAEQKLGESILAIAKKDRRHDDGAAQLKRKEFPSRRTARGDRPL